MSSIYTIAIRPQQQLPQPRKPAAVTAVADGRSPGITRSLIRTISHCAALLSSVLLPLIPPRAFIRAFHAFPQKVRASAFSTWLAVSHLFNRSFAHIPDPFNVHTTRLPHSNYLWHPGLHPGPDSFGDSRCRIGNGGAWASCIPFHHTRIHFLLSGASQHSGIQIRFRVVRCQGPKVHIK